MPHPSFLTKGNASCPIKTRRQIWQASSIASLRGDRHLGRQKHGFDQQRWGRLCGTLERDLARGVSDVHEGWVTRERAGDVYGVVITENTTLGEGATNAARSFLH